MNSTKPTSYALKRPSSAVDLVSRLRRPDLSRIFLPWDLLRVSGFKGLGFKV